jgi:tetratricopeptide (TPR) repeat protein
MKHRISTAKRTITMVVFSLFIAQTLSFKVFSFFPHVVIADTGDLQIQNELEKKLNIPEFHPLLSLPKKKDLDKKLLPVYERLIKLPIEVPPVLSFRKDASEEKCYPTHLNELNSLQKTGIRGIQDEVYFMKGILFELCGKLEKAEKEYSNSLSLRRRNPDILFRHAVVLLKIDQTNSVKSILEEAQWRDFRSNHLIFYLLGLNMNALDKTDLALGFFEKSLAKNENFIPAVIESYPIRKEMRSKASSPTELALLDARLYSDLALLNKLGHADRNMALEYIRHLLLSGDPLNSPQKLSEGNQLTSKWLDKSKGEDDDMLLMKIQFLEKLGKRDDAISLLNERESKGELSSALLAKKTFYESFIESDES